MIYHDTARSQKTFSPATGGQLLTVVSPLWKYPGWLESPCLMSHIPLPRSVKTQCLVHAGIKRPGWFLTPILKSNLSFKDPHWGPQWDWIKVQLFPLPNPSFNFFLSLPQVVIPKVFLTNFLPANVHCTVCYPGNSSCVGSQTAGIQIISLSLIVALKWGLQNHKRFEGVKTCLEYTRHTVDKQYMLAVTTVNVFPIHTWLKYTNFSTV